MKAWWRMAAAACVALAVNVAVGQKVGKPAPELDVPRLADSQSKDNIKLAKLKGKLVLLAFWRTTDWDSLDAIKTLNAIHKQFKDSGVLVLAHTPEEQKTVEDVVKAKGIEYALIGGGDLDERYKITDYPQAFIIDPRGTLVWRGPVTNELEELIKEQVEKTPPAAANTTALNNKLAEAKTLAGQGEPGKAYTIVKGVGEIAEEESAIGKEVKALKEETQKAAEKVLEEALDAVKGEEVEAPCRKIAELSVRLTGTDVGSDAEQQCARLQGERSLRDIIRKAVESAKGELRNDEAAEREAEYDYTAALEIYREVTEKHPDTPAAVAAEQAIERIKNDAKIQQRIAARRADEQADRWLALGDQFAVVEMYDQARQQYEKVINEHPRSKAATKAQQRLVKLPKPKPADSEKKTEQSSPRP